jgi:hypothetical protein
MRRTLSHLLFVAGLCLAGATLAGCKQGEGERCEVNNDCSAGLTCSRSGEGAFVCTSRPSAVDAATGPDGASAAEVGGADQSILTDAVSQDGAPSTDAVAAEVATEAGATEAGATEAGIDATPDSAAADAAAVTLDASSN